MLRTKFTMLGARKHRDERYRRRDRRVIKAWTESPFMRRIVCVMFRMVEQTEKAKESPVQIPSKTDTSCPVWPS